MIEAPQPDQPQGSFSERYRNIPYGPEAASAPPAAPAHRRLPLRLLVVGGIAVAIVVGALLGSQLLPSSATSPNANARRPSPPPASVDPGKQVMAKFWSVVRNPVLSYHIAAAGSWTGPAGTGSFISSLDVAGDD